MIALLLLVSSLQAGTFTITKQIEPATLRSELTTALFQVESLDCTGDICKLVLPDSELKDPLPFIEAHVYVDPRARIKQRRKQLITLARKLRNTPALMTATDRDNMLLLIAFLLVNE